MTDTLRRPLPSAALPLDLSGLREESQMSVDASRAFWGVGGGKGGVGLYGYSPLVVLALLDRIEEQRARIEELEQDNIAAQKDFAHCEDEHVERAEVEPRIAALEADLETSRARAKHLKSLVAALEEALRGALTAHYDGLREYRHLTSGPVRECDHDFGWVGQAHALVGKPRFVEEQDTHEWPAYSKSEPQT